MRIVSGALLLIMEKEDAKQSVSLDVLTLDRALAIFMPIVEVALMTLLANGAQKILLVLPPTQLVLLLNHLSILLLHVHVSSTEIVLAAELDLTASGV